MLRKTNSPDNINSTINTNDAETCGSGKKYKNCCGKNQQYQGFARFLRSLKYAQFCIWIQIRYKLKNEENIDI